MEHGELSDHETFGAAHERTRISRHPVVLLYGIHSSERTGGSEVRGERIEV